MGGRNSTHETREKVRVEMMRCKNGNVEEERKKEKKKKKKRHRKVEKETDLGKKEPVVCLRTTRYLVLRRCMN